MKKIMAVLLLIPIFLMIILFLTPQPYNRYFSDQNKFLPGNQDGLKLYDKNFLWEKVSLLFLIKGQTQSKDIYGQKGFEEGSANVVTSIVVGYRAFDTFGEIFILFLAISGIAAFYLKEIKVIKPENPQTEYIFEKVIPFLLPLFILFSFYIILNGHLTPGGGFQGGVIIAVASLLYFLSVKSYKQKTKFLKSLESISGFGYLFTGILGIIFAGSFLQNFLPTGTVGRIFSAGIIPVLYFLIGIKVASELTAMLGYFFQEKESV